MKEEESVDGCSEQGSLYGIEIEANKETNSGVCCRLSAASKSATAEVWPACANRRRLRNRVLEHERSNGHRECYLARRELDRSLSL